MVLDFTSAPWQYAGSIIRSTRRSLGAIALVGAAVLLSGCLRPHTKIEIPAAVFTPDAPATAPPARYYSERDMAIRITTAPDGSRTVEIIGAASPVLDSKGKAISGIVDSAGQYIPIPPVTP